MFEFYYYCQFQNIKNKKGVNYKMRVWLYFWTFSDTAVFYDMQTRRSSFKLPRLGLNADWYT